MSQVIIAGDTSGTITLQAPAVSGTTTLTLPAVTGTVLQSGTAVTEAQGGNGTTTGYYGFKNRIINGNFGINQRGVSGTVTLTAGSYGHDRFKAGASGCTYTFATSANITTLTISAGSLIQVIEGLNLESATYTLSFSGTAQGKIGAGSFSSSGVTGSVTGGSNLNIEFNTGTLSLAQLEKGSTATSFDYRPYGTELQLCQRYYQRLYVENCISVRPQSAGTGASQVYIPFLVQTRTTATIAFPQSNYNPSLGTPTAATGGTYPSIATNGVRIYSSGSASQNDTANLTCEMTVFAEL